MGNYKWPVLRQYVLAFLSKLSGVVLTLLLTIFITRTSPEAVAGEILSIIGACYVLAALFSCGVEYRFIRSTAINGIEPGSLSPRTTTGRTIVVLGTTASIGAIILTQIMIPAFVDEQINGIALYAVGGITITTLVGGLLQGAGRISLSILLTRGLVPLLTMLGSAMSLPLMDGVANSFVAACWITAVVAIYLTNITHHSGNQKASSTAETEDSYIVLGVISCCQQIFVWQAALYGILSQATVETAMLVAAQRASLLINFVLICVNTVNAPKFAILLSQKDTHGAVRLALVSALMSAGAALPFALFLFSWPEYALSVFGNGYETASEPLRILVIAQVIGCLFGPVGTIALMKTKKRDTAGAFVVSLLTGIFVFYSIKEFSSISIAGAYSIATTLITKNLLDLVIAHRILRRKLG